MSISQHCIVHIVYIYVYITVLVMMEGSGKWPEDLEAVRRLKAAFHIQLAKALGKQHGLKTQAYTTHVDVVKVRGAILGDYVFVASNCQLRVVRYGI